MHSPRHVSKEISGWGRFPRGKSFLYRPERRSSLLSILRNADAPTLLARGLGRSYGDAALNTGGGLILSSRLNRFLAFDTSNGVLTCEGGVSLEEIIAHFLPRGWFLPVTPGTRFATIGGAIACDVHGKNHHRDKAFSAHLQDIELMLPDGSLLHCSRDQNRDVFEATAGGMGLTGYIVSASLKLLPVTSAYIRQETRRTANLEQTLEALQTCDFKYRYSVAWLDVLSGGSSLGRGIVIGGDHAAPEDLPSRLRASPLAYSPPRPFSVPWEAPGFILNRHSIRVLNALYYHRHRSGPKTSCLDVERFFYPLDALLHWNRLYGRRGFLQYQCLLPMDRSERGLSELLERFRRAGLGSFLAVLKRFGPAAGPLSFPAPGYTLALDLPLRGGQVRRVLDEADALVADLGGRVYLGKDARLSPDLFRRMYPRFREWTQVRRRLDPELRLSSDLSRRLGMDGEV